jgi:ornithine cyclodeaminase/alanine dehydrogenase-like protein (mu-crystallin family)
MPRAIAALEAALVAGVADAPARAHLPVPGGELLLMPAAGADGVGVKLVTVNPRNPGRELPLIGGVYVLFDGDTLAPLLTIDGAALTALRTAAVSALATSRLASPDARRLVLFGAGAQARAHLEAMCAVRPIEEVVVVGGASAERAEALVAKARAHGLRARLGGPEAVREAEIVCTCTTSSVPVFPGALLAAGTHVNAVGAYRPDARELDDNALALARVVVDDERAAFAEAGDLLLALRSGALQRSAIVADLAALVAGAAVRRSPDDVTVLKSVGVAWEDLAIAVAAAGIPAPRPTAGTAA